MTSPRPGHGPVARTPTFGVRTSLTPLTIAVVHTFRSSCRCHRTILAACRALGHRTVEVDADRLPADLRRLRGVDLAFDHTSDYRGRGDRRAEVRACLESADIRTIGAPAFAVGICNDKRATRTLLSPLGIPMPPFVAVTDPRSPVPTPLGFPLVLKPAGEHSSRGLRRIDRPGDWPRALRAHFRRHPSPALAETFIPGREISVSLIGGRTPRMLPPQETRLPRGSGGLYTREAKRGPDSLAARHGSLVVPARLAPALRRALSRIARRVWRTLGLREYARLDFRVARGDRPYLLDVNATPGLEAGSEFLAAAAGRGMTPMDMVERLIALRRERPCVNEKSPAVISGKKPS